MYASTCLFFIVAITVVHLENTAGENITLRTSARSVPIRLYFDGVMVTDWMNEEVIVQLEQDIGMIMVEIDMPGGPFILKMTDDFVSDATNWRCKTYGSHTLNIDDSSWPAPLVQDYQVPAHLHPAKWIVVHDFFTYDSDDDGHIDSYDEIYMCRRQYGNVTTTTVTTQDSYISYDNTRQFERGTDANHEVETLLLPKHVSIISAGSWFKDGAVILASSDGFVTNSSHYWRCTYGKYRYQYFANETAWLAPVVVDLPIPAELEGTGAQWIRAPIDVVDDYAKYYTFCDGNYSDFLSSLPTIGHVTEEQTTQNVTSMEHTGSYDTTATTDPEISRGLHISSKPVGIIVGLLIVMELGHLMI